MSGGRHAADEPESAEIGPDEPGNGRESAEGGEIVPEEGLAGTHLTPAQVQGLVERSGPRGPADDIARRSR